MLCLRSFRGFGLVIPLLLVVAAGCTRRFDSSNANVETPEQMGSYAMGRNVGASLRSQGTKLEREAFIAGVIDGLDDKSRLTPEQTREGLLKMHEESVKQASPGSQAQFAKIAEANKQASQSFLALQKKKPGMKTTPTGLVYKIVKPGNGRSPDDQDVVVIHYTGKLVDGLIFDSSILREKPATLPVSELVVGWREALKMIKPGGKMEVTIPPSLAFGEAGAGSIGPNAALHVEIELIEILGPKKTVRPPAPIEPRTVQ